MQLIGSLSFLAHLKRYIHQSSVKKIQKQTDTIVFAFYKNNNTKLIKLEYKFYRKIQRQAKLNRNPNFLVEKLTK